MQELAKAWEHTSRADLALVLGSSLKVAPACTMPGQVAKTGGRLVIVNLQRTHFDGQASLVCDHSLFPRASDQINALVLLGSRIRAYLRSMFKFRFLSSGTAMSTDHSFKRVFLMMSLDIPCTMIQNIFI